MKYPNARIFQGNELLVLAVRLFDAGRVFAASHPDGLTPQAAEERKATVINIAESAQTKIPADEPWFLLRSQDQFAPTGVARYARATEERGMPRPFVDRVIDFAVGMENWQEANADRVKRPD